MALRDIVMDVILEHGYRTLDRCVVSSADAQDAEITSLEEHDASYHPDGYKEGDTCKYRDDLKKGDNADVATKSESKQKDSASDKDRMSEIFREYRHSPTRSEGWLYKNLGITDHKAKNKASSVIAAFAMGQIDKKKALQKLISLSSGLPKDAWKKGAKSGAKSNLGSFKQLSLPGISSASSVSSTSSSPWSKYYHAQGSHEYTQEKHAPTGLYKTKRQGGKALAREEDVPGLTPFHKRRPFFKETGTVPSSLSDDDLSNFRYTANGSTYPTVGNVGGRNYIVKHGVLPKGVRRNDDLNDHLRTEIAADRFIRAAGLNAPVCSMFEREIPKDKNAVDIDEQTLTDLYDKVMIYKIAKSQYEQLKDSKSADPSDVKEAKGVKDAMKDDYRAFKDSLGKDYSAYKEALQSRVDKNGNLMPKKNAPTKEVVKIAEYVDGGVALPRVWHSATKAEKDAIRKQVVAAYPVMAFLENVDAFKNDNVLVDRDNRIWFVDNGACFDYRAQGGKKLLSGDNRMSSHGIGNPWFYERQDPTDDVTGYLGLAYAPDQGLLQDILSETSDAELVEAAKKYKFSDLVKTLPKELQKPGLVSYAGKLDEAVRNPPKGWIDDDNQG